MTTPATNAADLLRQEILDEARRQRENILIQARQEAAAIVTSAEQKVEQCRRERMEAASAEASRRTEAILATVPVEAGRMRLACVEKLLQDIHEGVRERLQTRAGFDFRAAIARLSAEALEQMAGEAFRLRLSMADHRAVADGLVQEIQLRSRHPAVTLRLVVDPNLKDGDVWIEDEDARQVCSLSPAARLERCWPELRRQIAAHARLTEQGPV